MSLRQPSVYVLDRVYAAKEPDSDAWPLRDSVGGCRWSRIVHSENPLRSELRGERRDD